MCLEQLQHGGRDHAVFRDAGNLVDVNQADEITVVDCASGEIAAADIITNYVSMATLRIFLITHQCNTAIFFA